LTNKVASVDIRCATLGQVAKSLSEQFAGLKPYLAIDENKFTFIQYVRVNGHELRATPNTTFYEGDRLEFTPAIAGASDDSENIPPSQNVPTTPISDETSYQIAKDHDALITRLRELMAKMGRSEPPTFSAAFPGKNEPAPVFEGAPATPPENRDQATLEFVRGILESMIPEAKRDLEDAEEGVKREKEIEKEIKEKSGTPAPNSAEQFSLLAAAPPASLSAESDPISPLTRAFASRKFSEKWLNLVVELHQGAQAYETAGPFSERVGAIFAQEGGVAARELFKDVRIQLIINLVGKPAGLPDDDPTREQRAKDEQIDLAAMNLNEFGLAGRYAQAYLEAVIQGLTKTDFKRLGGYVAAIQKHQKNYPGTSTSQAIQELRKYFNQVIVAKEATQQLMALRDWLVILQSSSVGDRNAMVWLLAYDTLPLNLFASIARRDKPELGQVISQLPYPQGPHDWSSIQKARKQIVAGLEALYALPTGSLGHLSPLQAISPDRVHPFVSSFPERVHETPAVNVPAPTSAAPLPPLPEVTPKQLDQLKGYDVFAWLPSVADQENENAKAARFFASVYLAEDRGNYLLDRILESIKVVYQNVEVTTQHSDTRKLTDINVLLHGSKGPQVIHFKALDDHQWYAEEGPTQNVEDYMNRGVPAGIDEVITKLKAGYPPVLIKNMVFVSIPPDLQRYFDTDVVAFKLTPGLTLRDIRTRLFRMGAKKGMNSISNLLDPSGHPLSMSYEAISHERLTLQAPPARTSLLPPSRALGGNNDIVMILPRFLGWPTLVAVLTMVASVRWWNLSLQSAMLTTMLAWSAMLLRTLYRRHSSGHRSTAEAA
jgi:hypothetical protein